MSHAAGDPYVDPASGVLPNLLGITDAAEPARSPAATTSIIMHSMIPYGMS
ncbi:MAG TPA: hypothetical protein VHS27_12165 [Gaiellales bacterium]|nr:hypothetical protein [Gaiellales bacterium]